MKRRTPPTWLTEPFHQTALAYFTHSGPEAPGQPLRLYAGGPACWLKQFDHLDRPCSGDLEAVHLISRQRIRNVLRPLLADLPLADASVTATDLDEIVELAEWDPRNGVPGCTGHHRRFDSHATPELKVPGLWTPGPFWDFVLGWALESDAERKFDGLSPILAKHLAIRIREANEAELRRFEP